MFAASPAATFRRGRLREARAPADIPVAGAPHGPRQSSPPAPRNRLLAALPPDDLAGLWPRLEPAELPFRRTLHAAGEPITTVYFPETGWVSMLAHLEDGDAAEVGLVGREGFVGLPVLLGAECDDIEAMVQCPGTALRMDAAAFREALERIPALRTLLLRYALVHHGQVARTAACNGRHHDRPAPRPLAADGA